MAGHVQTNQTIQLPDAAYTVNAADTGKIFLVPTLTAAGRTFTLPAVAAGLRYRFINNPAAATLVGPGIISGGGTTVHGALLNVTPVVVAKTGQASCRFLAASVKGDYIDVMCDGTNWNVSGMSGVVGLGA